MSELEFVLHAEPRSDLGKGASRRLRRAEKIPAILYGGGTDPEPITLSQDEVFKALEHEAFYTHVITVKIGDREEKAVIKDIQRHPYKPKVHHMDLQRVSEKEKIQMRVPLHFVGEDVAPGVKQGGLLTKDLVEVEVRCLPRHLPEYITVDVSNLGLGDVLHLSDLALPEGVELVEILHGHDLPVASVHRKGGDAVEAGEEAGGEETEG